MSRAELTRFNLIAAAAAAAPLVLMSAAPALLGTGPRLSMGAGNAPAEPAPVIADPKPTPAQQAAQAHAALLLTHATPQSPFRPTPAPVEAPAPVQPEPVAPAPAPPPPPEIIVRSIMRQGDGSARALIAGKLRAVGDEAAPGWTITAIDTAARSITITSADGRSETISRK